MAGDWAISDTHLETADAGSDYPPFGLLLLSHSETAPDWPG